MQVVGTFVGIFESCIRIKDFSHEHIRFPLRNFGTRSLGKGPSQWQ